MVEMLTISAHVHSHTSTPTRAKSIQSYTPTLIPPGVPDARAACDMHVPACACSSIELACGNTRAVFVFFLGRLGQQVGLGSVVRGALRRRIVLDWALIVSPAVATPASSMPLRCRRERRRQRWPESYLPAAQGRGMDASRGALIEPELVVRIRRPGARWRARAVIFVVARWREGGQVAWIASYARRLLA